MNTEEQKPPLPAPRPQQVEQQRKGQPERLGLIITNSIKLGGLIVAMNEALVKPEIRPSVIGLAALMMAGAQSLETFLTSFFGGKK